MRTKRVYKVLSREDAEAIGARTFTTSEHSRYALVAVRGDVLDNVIAWGYKRESLEQKAIQRNKDIAMLGKMVGKATKLADAEEAMDKEQE